MYNNLDNRFKFKYTLNHNVNYQTPGTPNEFGYSVVYDDYQFANSGFGLIFAGAPSASNVKGSGRIGTVRYSTGTETASTLVQEGLVKISSIDGKPFSLTSFSATEDCLKADIDPNKVAKEFVLYPKVDLEKLKSLKIPKGVVRIGHTHPGCDVIKLNYDLFVRYAFAPKRFLVLNADQRKTRTQRLTIVDNYANSLRLKNDGKESMFALSLIHI